MILAVLGSLVMGGGAFYVGWNLFSGELEASAASRLEQQKKKTSNALLKLSRPLFHALVLPYSIRLKNENWKKKQKRLIVSAGLEEEIDAEELMAFKIFLGFLVPIAFAIFMKVNGSAPPWWLLGTMVIGGFMYPSVWVSGSRGRRHEEIRLQMPFVIDLLTLSTEAGLDFIGALQKVVEKTRSGPLVNEIERMLQEISSLVAVLVTADQMGSPLGGVLRVQSELIRTQRFVNAEKRGAAASQKLLFPLIFFIMPAVFIMIFGPVILGFLGVK
ncbi:MAG: type II secretion system F family protein [Deltaproteobacteria bacterium]|nr:type II secretion system F family protein [Deltaproteobacteria bacterium]